VKHPASQDAVAYFSASATNGGPMFESFFDNAEECDFEPQKQYMCDRRITHGTQDQYSNAVERRHWFKWTTDHVTWNEYWMSNNSAILN
jgi:hypothetical protein